MNTIGQRIRIQRQKRNWTQRELGTKSGLAGAQISEYETDKVRPKIDRLRKIADALEISIAALDPSLVVPPNRQDDVDDGDALTEYMLEKWSEMSIDARCRIVAMMTEMSAPATAKRKSTILHRIARMGNPSRNVIDCPHCSRKITIPASLESGARLTCPDCGQSIIIGGVR